MRDGRVSVRAGARARLSHIYVNGQAGYHGVAILSRIPAEVLGAEAIGGNPDARHMAARIGGRVDVHNVYIPAGGDIPDAEANPKFGQKLAYIGALADWFGGGAAEAGQLILAGDFNVAPLEHDVWSHKQLLEVVSHTPIEVENFWRGMRASPTGRRGPQSSAGERKLYTWWSYRNRDWKDRRSRAAAGSYLDDAQPCERREGYDRGAGNPQLGANFRSRSRDRGFRSGAIARGAYALAARAGAMQLQIAFQRCFGAYIRLLNLNAPITQVFHRDWLPGCCAADKAAGREDLQFAIQIPKPRFAVLGDIPFKQFIETAAIRPPH